MPSNRLILCCPLLLLPSIFPSIRAFSEELVFTPGGRSIGTSASFLLLEEAHGLKPPTLARHHSNLCMRRSTTEGPGKEHGSNKPPSTRRVLERSNGDTTCPTTSQNPSLWHPSWRNKACTTRKDSEPEGLAKDNPETNPITIKPQTASHVTELFSWVPLPCCSPPGCPFPIKSLVCQHMRLLGQSISECWTRAQFQALEGVPLPATLPVNIQG